MKMSYYPGCTLKTKAADLDKYARASLEALGITLEEIPEWQCCGGVYPMSRDEIATRLPSIRALKAAAEAEMPLVTVCSACHHVIKRVNDDMKTDAEMRAKAAAYMGGEEYTGSATVYHFLEVLRDVVGFDTLRSKVVNPLKGRKIAPYYGCLLLRPGKVMEMDNPENPAILEDLIRAIGAEPVYYSDRNECCGGYVRAENPTVAEKRSAKITSGAAGAGADEMITACPLCMYNLRKADGGVKITYFTELLAEALGVKESAK